MSGLTELALAIVLGGAFAAGLVLVSTRIPRLAAPTLSRRIAPYLRDIADPRGLTPLASARGDWRTRRDRVISSFGGAARLEHRLRQAGWTQDAAAFRARQLTWVLLGGLFGGVVLVVLALAGRLTPGSALLPPVLALSAAAVLDLRLTSAARRRRARVEEELPTLLEFLSLCLAAGEGLRDALRRVGEIGTGELTVEIRRAVLDSGTGSNLSDALLDLGRRLDVPTLSRAIEHLVAAIDRGAPLAGVLQAQAGDAREDAKRSLIEQAGKKEIAMLFPIVFLLLPMSVLFAVFPGIVMLRLGVG
ncbi:MULTISPECIES: type II secretion system F family protein [unclassified Microbacterium]|uniref:type II secretion system F family protein n=1 Tax=unclassified Microbacterium TaxID=2609290 RepID=UPI000369D82C|nr:MULTISPECIES: type II secretion system F family protein [unclassified Microbacterium]SDG20962.1 tight adherence protein C [Microbacterium sp. 77mftsu3.1]